MLLENLHEFLTSTQGGTHQERAARATAEAAAPKGIVATASKSKTDTYGAQHRAREIVRTLGERIVRDGWVFDRTRAARFLNNIRKLDPDDGDAMEPIVEWVSDHGQSLDWIFCGNPSVMICRLASIATVPTKAKPKLVVITSDGPATPGAA